MKYKVAWGESIAELMVHVQQLIDCGWRPQGGVAFDGKYHIQAMVHES